MKPTDYHEDLLDRPSSRYKYLRWQAESFVYFWCRAHNQLPRESDVRKSIDALENGLLSWGPRRIDIPDWRQNGAFNLREHQPESHWRAENLWHHLRLGASLAWQQLRLFVKHGCCDMDSAAIGSWLRPTRKVEFHWRGQLPACCFTTLLEERPAREDDSFIFCRYCSGDLHFHLGAWEKLPVPEAPKTSPKLSQEDNSQLIKACLDIEAKIAASLKPKPMSPDTLERVLSLKHRKIIIGSHRYNSLGHYLDEVPPLSGPPTHADTRNPNPS